jgi:hypothetical protein
MIRRPVSYLSMIKKALIINLLKLEAQNLFFQVLDLLKQLMSFPVVVIRCARAG